MKKILNKIFFGLEISWNNVVLLAVISAIYIAAMLVIPFTVNTSFAASGTTFELWILLALIIILNSHKPIEAGLKTFVFFLISQPLIYLFQVPFSHLGWSILMFYPRWFIFTLLTFPGAIIAWFIKKDNLFSALILTVATVLLVYLGKYYVAYVINRFPYYTLAMLFCFIQAFGYEFVLLKRKENKIVCFILTLLSAILILVFNII